MRPRRYLERNRDCVRTGFAPGRPPPVHPRLTGACAAMRGFQICVSGHAQMQRPPSAWPALRPSSRCQTARRVICPRSPSRSRGAFSAPGLSRRCSLSPPHLCCLGRRFGGARAQILGVSCSSDPEMRGRRSAGRRTTLIRRAGKTRPHACEACPSRATGTSASRRSTVALPGPRCVSGISAGAGARLARRPSFMAGYGPRVRPRLRAAADATPRSACQDRLRRRPS